MKNELFQCCFCGEVIHVVTEPSVSLIAIKNWELDLKDHMQQQLFCHEECFKKVLSNPKLYYLQYL
jgi:hypothetical protein